MFQDSFGGLTTRLYDVLNRVVTMSYTGQTAALREDFAYSVRDQVAGQIRYGNLAGTTTVGYSTFTYDGVGRVTNLRHSNGSGANIANYTNTYDLASRITSEVLNAGLPTTYQYDVTDQLTNDSVVSYSYDLNGNRTMTGYATGPANELTSDGTWNYAYDKNGNLIQKTNISTGEVFAFGYDIRNRMVAATDTTTSSLQMQATYVYDALGQRIEKNVEVGGIATVTEFAYNESQIWADLNSSNALQMRYLRTENVLELPATVSSGGTASWMLADRMGSLRNVLNSTGTVIDTITYDGFGNNLSESGPANGGLYKYAGYRFDSEIEMFRSDASTKRYYLAWVGRFNSIDPILFDARDANLWRYVGNNPANTMDPRSEDTLKELRAKLAEQGYKMVGPGPNLTNQNQWVTIKESGLLEFLKPKTIAYVTFDWQVERVLEKPTCKKEQKLTCKFESKKTAQLTFQAGVNAGPTVSLMVAAAIGKETTTGGDIETTAEGYNKSIKVACLTERAVWHKDLGVQKDGRHYGEVLGVGYLQDHSTAEFEKDVPCPIMEKKEGCPKKENKD